MKHLLFDLDGTIIEPQEGILNSLRHAVDMMGVAMPTDDELRQFIGPPIVDSFQRQFGLSPSEAQQGIQYFRNYYAQTGIHQNALFPHIPELFKSLHQLGYMLYVATSKPTVFAKEILQKHELDHLFVEIVGSNLDNSRSDKAEIIGYILDTYQLKPSHCLMIGDTPYDIIGAKKHHMQSVGVTYGHGHFKHHQADFTVDDVYHLEALIKKEFPVDN